MTAWFYGGGEGWGVGQMTMFDHDRGSGGRVIKISENLTTW